MELIYQWRRIGGREERKGSLEVMRMGSQKQRLHSEKHSALIMQGNTPIALE